MANMTHRISVVIAWSLIASGTAVLFACAIREALSAGQHATCAVLAMVGGALAVVVAIGWYWATKRGH
jgi:hypothetical protein